MTTPKRVCVERSGSPRPVKGRRLDALKDIMDLLIEKAVRSLGTRLWDEMKSDARLPFEPKGAGDVTLRSFVEQFAKRAVANRPIKLHLVGHSMGAVLLAHLLAAPRRHGHRRHPHRATEDLQPRRPDGAVGLRDGARQQVALGSRLERVRTDHRR